jgi:hypothetical protein
MLVQIFLEHFAGAIHVKKKPNVINVENVALVLENSLGDSARTTPNCLKSE